MNNEQQKILNDILEDGIIDTEEVQTLESFLYDDGIIDTEEVELLLALKKEAKKVVPEFDNLFYRAISDNILADGDIDNDEVVLLSEILSITGLTNDTKQFLLNLKDKSNKQVDGFLELLKNNHI